MASTVPRLMSYALLPLLGLVGVTSASGAEQAVAAGPIHSPEVLPDGRVLLRLRAPQALEVTLAGDYQSDPVQREPLQRDAEGVWSVTIGPLAPDLYSYFFTVDGVPMPDPANGLLKPGVAVQQSMFAIPGPPEQLLEAAPVPHGEVRIIYYPSKILGNQRRMHVYLPPDYERSKQHYPVVYLFHGGGDDDQGWLAIGRVNYILDNLLAAGTARPMIVVMPNLWTMDTRLGARMAQEDMALFQRSFFEETVPYIEQHFRSLPGRSNRAVGGLGPGRGALPEFLWRSLDQIGTAFFVSGGATSEEIARLDSRFPGVLDNPANIRQVRFFLGDGASDGSASSSRALADALHRRGYAVQRFEAPGGHGWPAFRRSFIEFVQSAFRQGGSVGSDAKQ